MYFAVAHLAPLIHRVLSVSRVRLLLPVKANICDIIYQKKRNVKWEKGKTFGKGRGEAEIFSPISPPAVDKIRQILYNEYILNNNGLLRKPST